MLSVKLRDSVVVVVTLLISLIGMAGLSVIGGETTVGVPTTLLAALAGISLLLIVKRVNGRLGGSSRELLSLAVGILCFTFGFITAGYAVLAALKLVLSALTRS